MHLNPGQANSHITVACLAQTIMCNHLTYVRSLNCRISSSILTQAQPQ